MSTIMFVSDQVHGKMDPAPNPLMVHDDKTQGLPFCGPESLEPSGEA